MSILSSIIIILVLLFGGATHAAEQPGPSADLLANPTYGAGVGLLYTCSRNFYVATTGNDANNGSSGSPWLTIQHADATALQAGDCVNVAAGTYTWASTFRPTKGGNLASQTGYIAYRCQTLNACKIVYAGTAGFPVWAVTSSYLIFDGLDIDGGEAATYGGLATVCFDSSVIDTTNVGHHIWILNNRIHGCGLACIAFSDTEYVFSLHNEVFNCAWTSQFEGSGIGYVVMKALGGPASPFPAYTPTTQDLSYAPFHNMVNWNKVHDNGCTTCLGTYTSFTTTGNVHSNLTLDGLASTGTQSAFTAQIAGQVMTVSSVMSGTLVVGQLISGATPTTINQGVAIQSQASGTPGGAGTYNMSGFQNLNVDTAMTGAQIGQLMLVTGPCIQPMTYVNTIVGSTVTLTRPTTCTQSGGTYKFQTLGNGHSDGNGIIMDTNCNGSCFTPVNQYPFQILISFNDCQFNGARGIHIFLSSFNTVINNSAYHNGLDIIFQGLTADLSESNGQQNVWYSNAAYAVNTISPYCLGGVCNFALGAGGTIAPATNTYTNNVLFGLAPAQGVVLFDNDAVTYDTQQNRGNSDPLYVDETSSTLGDLHLQAGSPAINYGQTQSFPFIPKGTTDAGAYQTGGTRTAFKVGFDQTNTVSEFTLPIVPTPLSCSQATTFLARTTGLDRVHTDGYSNLICGMVIDATWCGSKLDVFYVFATQDTNTARLNLCSASFSATLHGSPNFLKDAGYLGADNSSTVFIDTGFNPNTAGGNWTQNSSHSSAWSLTDLNSTTLGSGAVLGATLTGLTRIFPRVSGIIDMDINDSGFSVSFASNPNATGFYLANRTASTGYTAYKNAQSQFTSSNTSAQTGANIYILAVNNAGVGANGGAYRIAASTLGAGLSSGDITAICHRINIYLTAVGAAAAGIC